MLVQLEFALLILGLVGSVFVTVAVSNYNAIPHALHQFFDGAGGGLLACTLFAGLAGIVTLVINLISGRSVFWEIRLGLAFSFLMASFSWGLYD